MMKKRFLPLAFIIQFGMMPLANAQQKGVFDDIVGSWTNDAKVVSTHSKTNKNDSFWTGRMYGQVTPTGRFVFVLDNRCRINGLAIPFYSTYNFEAEVKSCTETDLNGIYSGTVNRNGLTLTFSGSMSKIFPGAWDRYTIVSTMIKY